MLAEPPHAERAEVSVAAAPAAAAPRDDAGTSDWDQSTGICHTADEVEFTVVNGTVLRIATGGVLAVDSKDAADVESLDGTADDDDEDSGIAWTGGTVWGAAIPLARHLTQLELDWGATSVCELGAGCGLCGLVAVALGAKRVLLTDRVLRMLTHNADANFNGEDRKRINVQNLEWGSSGGAGSAGRARAGAGFDLVVGSDLIYNISAVQLVAETMAMLSKKVRHAI